MKVRFIALMLATLTACSTQAEEFVTADEPAGRSPPKTLTRPDFKLPLGVPEKLPPGVAETDVYVSDDFCFYWRDGNVYHFFDCVG